MNAKTSFAPVLAPHCHILVLGSLPGDASLAAGHYYAHPRNAFWPIMSTLTGTDLPALDWPQRYHALLHAGIALWDTIDTATRRGSLDTALRDITANPLHDCLGQLPQLRLIACNGQTAGRLAGRQLPGDSRLCILPSTSPALTLPLTTKLLQWQAALAPHLETSNA
ncbi:DNA-deoxyinosine glycosylase [Chitinilyticum piscinae]|uniref:DNA-deoxyinosine glycosylase n=1 Tax=Chitinilyticum piscinae TaxID=2866724 RepID=A0A8J7KGP6_9NEIS|nr:DNA-deoxyinosine glycosylase [Chitinilyticum piscinae]MBE9610584.1 DNA-deoxyinosine glycosylase [Chitinilyticum piscinae]